MNKAHQSEDYVNIKLIDFMTEPVILQMYTCSHRSPTLPYNIGPCIKLPFFHFSFVEFKLLNSYLITSSGRGSDILYITFK